MARSWSLSWRHGWRRHESGSRRVSQTTRRMCTIPMLNLMLLAVMFSPQAEGLRCRCFIPLATVTPGRQQIGKDSAPPSSCESKREDTPATMKSSGFKDMAIHGLVTMFNVVPCFLPALVFPHAAGPIALGAGLFALGSGISNPDFSLGQGVFLASCTWTYFAFVIWLLAKQEGKVDLQQDSTCETCHKSLEGFGNSSKIVCVSWIAISVASMVAMQIKVNEGKKVLDDIRGPDKPHGQVVPDFFADVDMRTGSICLASLLTTFMWVYTRDASGKSRASGSDEASINKSDGVNTKPASRQP